MNQHRLYICALTAALVSAQSALPARAAEKTENGWELQQVSFIVGKPTVLLSPTGIKIILKKAGLKVVAVAPEWKVFLYNDLNKVFFACPLKSFNSSMYQNEALWSGCRYDNLPFAKDARVQILQLDAIKYKTLPWLAKRAVSENKEGWTDRGAVTCAYYCLADRLSVPTQEGLILAKFYGLTTLTGVPLDFSYVNLGKEHRSRLLTTLCQRKAIPVSEFARPSGYRAVKTVQEVSVDISQSKGLDNMMEGLGHLMK